MVFLKVNEPHGGPVIVNMSTVVQITDAGSEQARLWFGQADVDTMLIRESLDDIEKMLDVVLTGCNRVIDKEQMEMITSSPARPQNGVHYL